MENKNPSNLKELIQKGYVEIAKLPEKNQINPEELDKLDAYTVPLIAHDYGAKTPIMWNTLYEKKGLNLRNIMLVANPKENANLIIGALKSDPKYLGGGFGVGWKERTDLVDRVIPEDLNSINIVVREGKELVGYNTDAAGFVKSLEEKFYEIGKEMKSSNFVLLGAGGVAKEVAKLIAEKGAERISIINRSYDKAVKIAYNLNSRYGKISVGGGEEIIRGYLLNSFVKPDAIINTTDKGSDGPLKEYSAFAEAEIHNGNGKACNENISRTIARELKRLNPEVIIADIVIPKNPPSRTLAIAKNEGLENLVDGIGMVVYQAVPAYLKIQEANPEKHKKRLNENEILETFKEAAVFKMKEQEV
jgi:shikimate 5-dehydrogenase